MSDTLLTNIFLYTALICLLLDYTARDLRPVTEPQ